MSSREDRGWRIENSGGLSFAILYLLSPILVFFSAKAQAAEAAPHGKILEWGWDSRPAVPELMKTRWHASFGIWLDYGHKWDANDFDKNFFTPAEFAYAVHEALAHTQAYAWV